jgi:hypothetical protein
MNVAKRYFSRRDLFKILGAATSGIALGRWLEPDTGIAQKEIQAKAIETFTGPGANRHWNSVGPYVAEPQKVPLILLTDRSAGNPAPLLSYSIYA